MGQCTECELDGTCFIHNNQYAQRLGEKREGTNFIKQAVAMKATVELSQEQIAEIILKHLAGKNIEAVGEVVFVTTTTRDPSGTAYHTSVKVSVDLENAGGRCEDCC